MTPTGTISSHSTEPIWFSYSGNRYAGKFPDFFDPSELPCLNEITKHFEAIRNEILTALGNQNTMQPYFNLSMVEGSGSWDVLHLVNWGRLNPEAPAAFPMTSSAIKTIPGLLSLGIAKLSAHTEVKSHIGDTNAIIRCHLGLQIPAGLPDCGIEVAGTQRAWEEGKWIAFCDAHEHKSWNRSTTERYILIADIVQDAFDSEKEEICRNVLSYHVLQSRMQKHPWMKMLPRKVRGILRRYYKSKL